MEKKAYIDILLAAALWGCIGIFVHPLTGWGFTQMQVVFFRSASAALLLGLTMIGKNKKMLRIKPKDIWCFLGTGLVSLLLFNVCYFNAMRYTTLSVAAVLLYTAPGFVMIFSAILFREPITLRKFAALCVMFAGCVLVTGMLGGGQPLTSLGLVFGIGSGIGYALYSIFGRYALLRGYAPLTISFYTFLFAALGSVPLFGNVTLEQPPTLPVLGAVIFLFGGISCVLPYWLYTRGLQTVDNGTASVMATVEPAVATLISLLVFHEPMTLGTVAGMLLIFGGIVLIHAKKKTVA